MKQSVNPPKADENWNCLSPAQRDEFSNFSEASLALSKMDKPAHAGFEIDTADRSNRNAFYPAAIGRGIKNHNKKGEKDKPFSPFNRASHISFYSSCEAAAVKGRTIFFNANCLVMPFPEFDATENS